GDDVTHLGDVVQGDGLGGKKSGGHRGQRGGFRAAGFYRTVERPAAAYSEFIHFKIFPNERLRYLPIPLRRFPPASFRMRRACFAETPFFKSIRAKRRSCPV